MVWYISHHWRHIRSFCLSFMREGNMATENTHSSANSYNSTVQVICSKMMLYGTGPVTNPPVTVSICSVQRFAMKEHVRRVRQGIYRNSMVDHLHVQKKKLLQHHHAHPVTSCTLALQQLQPVRKSASFVRSRQKTFFTRCPHLMQANN